MPKDRMPKIDDADVVHEFPLKDVALLRNALLAYEPRLAMDKLRVTLLAEALTSSISVLATDDKIILVFDPKVD